MRGRLAECKVAAGGGEGDLTCYLADQQNGRKALLLVNKHPVTRADVTLEIAGLKGSAGSATLQRLEAANAKSGPKEEKIDLTSRKISLPAYSVSTLLLD